MTQTEQQIITMMREIYFRDADTMSSKNRMTVIERKEKQFLSVYRQGVEAGKREGFLEGIEKTKLTVSIAADEYYFEQSKKLKQSTNPEQKG